MYFGYEGKLKKVLLNDEWSDVGGFDVCASLTSISLPRHARRIFTDAFMGTPIEHLYVPESVIEMGAELLMKTDYNPEARITPSVTINGTDSSPKIHMEDSFCRSGETEKSEQKLRNFYIFKNAEYEMKYDDYGHIGMDSLILGNIKELTIVKNKADRRFLPTTAICLSHYLTSCDMWKPTSGKIYVLPGSQLPADDITYMYTVNKLNYEMPEVGNVIFDGVNNMPFDITPVFYQDDKEVALSEAGTYDLSMKISGTTYDGIYPTGLKVTVASSTGINNVTMDDNTKQCPIYNMNGQRVDSNYKGVIIQNGKKRIAK